MENRNEMAGQPLQGKAMNEQDRAELDRLKRRQADLLEGLTKLNRELATLEVRLAQPERTTAPETPKPRIADAPSAQAAGKSPSAPVFSPPAPPPLVSSPGKPPVMAPVIAQTATASPVAKPAPAIPPAQPRPEPRPVSTQATRAALTEAGQIPQPAKTSSFEMRLGTYWLVRIGIVIFLTGVVFAGNYAYQNYVGKLGPVGKLALLYLVGGGLLGTGAWLQRKQESLKNYSQVLLAGGLAAVYFTTYAAHHIAPLQVIKSPLLDGALLLGWAGFIIWLADRTKSEVLALFAVLLVYYTSIITHIGLFTLYSNLVLTLAAVFFLVRNRWATLSFASLVATYVSYGFWRFFQDGHWQWATPEEGLWTGNYFLMGYWVLFTVAAFLSKHEQFARERRALFVGINKGAFLGAFIRTRFKVHNGGFGKFSLT